MWKAVSLDVLILYVTCFLFSDNDFPKIVSTVVWCGQSYGPLIETRHNVTFVYYPAYDRQFGRFDIKFSLGMMI